MNTLLTFDATRFDRHISKQDDKAMVDYIVREYGPALNHAVKYFGCNIAESMRHHYNDAYFNAATDEDAYNNLDGHTEAHTFVRRTITDDGEVVSKKARYDELVDLCIESFNEEIAAYLRSIQLDQVRQIYTVQVLGYENRLLRVLLTTDRPIIP